MKNSSQGKFWWKAIQSFLCLAPRQVVSYCLSASNPPSHILLCDAEILKAILLLCQQTFCSFLPRRDAERRQQVSRRNAVLSAHGLGLLCFLFFLESPSNTSSPQEQQLTAICNVFWCREAVLPPLTAPGSPVLRSLGPTPEEPPNSKISAEQQPLPVLGCLLSYILYFNHSNPFVSSPSLRNNIYFLKLPLQGYLVSFFAFSFLILNNSLYWIFFFKISSIVFILCLGWKTEAN